MKKILLLLACAFLLSGFGTAPKANDKAVNFTLYDVDGSPIALESFRGGTVLVTFFTTWCPSCQDELPKLEQLFERYHSREFHVLGVDMREGEPDVKAFARENNLTFPIVLDKSGRIGKIYKVVYIPRNFLIDKDGVIRFTSHYIQPEDLEKEIVKILEK